MAYLLNPEGDAACDPQKLGSGSNVCIQQPACGTAIGIEQPQLAICASASGADPAKRLPGSSDAPPDLESMEDAMRSMKGNLKRKNQPESR